MRAIGTASLVAVIMNGLATAAQAQSAAPAIIHNSGHSSSVNTLAFAPDGRWLVSGSDDGTIKLWDRASGRLLRTLVGHTEGVTWVQVTSDGRSVVSLSQDRTAKLWEAATGRLVRTISDLTAGGPSYDLALGKGALGNDATVFYAASYDSIRRFDLATGKSQRVIGSQGTMSFWEVFALSPDNRLIAAAHAGPVGASYKNSSGGAQVKLIDATKGTILRVLGNYSEKQSVDIIVFSPDGKMIAVGGQEGTVKVWETASGRLLYTVDHSVSPSQRYITGITFSRDSRLLVTTGSVKGMRFWDAATGKLLRKLEDEPYGVAHAVEYSPSGEVFVTTSSSKVVLTDAEGAAPLPVTFGHGNAFAVSLAPMVDGRWLVIGPSGVSVWDASTWQLSQLIAPKPDFADGASQFVSDGTDGHPLVVTRFSRDKANALDVWNATNAERLRVLEWGPTPKPEKPCPTCATYNLENACISPDGRWIAATLWGDHTVIKVWNARTGELAFKLPQSNGTPYRAADMLAFSADSRWLIVGNHDAKNKHAIKFFDLTTGQLGRTLLLPTKQPGYGGEADHFAFSPDGREVASQYSDLVGSNSYRTVAIFDAASGKLIRPLPGDKVANQPTVVRYAPDGKSIYVGAYNSQNVNVWDAASGRLLRQLEGNPGQARSLAFASDGRHVVVGNENGTSAVYDTRTGSRQVITLHNPSGEWVTITPEGFFSASPRGAELLHIVRGFEATGIDQFYQSLYRPDLVREKLAGDPRGMVREAAAGLDLNKVVASGSPPDVRLTLPGRSVGAGSVAGETIAAEAEITDRGGGIGRIEWRVNGVTVGVDSAAGSPSPVRPLRRLALDPGRNTIEVVAYNSANLVASVPSRLDVSVQVASPSLAPAQPSVPSAPVATVKPRLFVLVAGVNDYADKRIKLAYAVSDAKEMVRGFQEASGNLYQSVEARLMTDAEVTRERLDVAFAEMAGKTSISDVFVLYLAGHGKTVDGRYYFIPQDFSVDGELDDKAVNSAVKVKGIAQDQWQKWFASVPARKSVILFDTCDSGTLAGDETQELERTAANDRLAQATGRSILAASGGSEEAIEGYRGHGLFTYNVLDAIFRSDGDNSGTVELNELAAYVYGQVSELSQKVFKQRQVPQMKLTGNYPLAKPTRILMDEVTPVAEGKPAYQVAQTAQLQVQPGAGATVVRSLSTNTRLTVLESRNGWSLVASDGKALGYVATRDLAPAQ